MAPGGFVGVDVFFVISGFLITGLLLREREQAGGVDLARFYARRLRRLLPAAAVVLAVGLAATWILVGPLDRPAIAVDAASAALSVANIRFALNAGDYFAAVAQPSPFLHFWSLAVEDQFYLVWPALLLLAGRGRRRWIGVVLGVVIGGSFVLNVLVTRSLIGWAFYSLPTRAWELAIGGLLAVVSNRAWLPERPGPRRTAVLALGAAAGWAGLLAVIGAGLALGEDRPYPGLAALIPAVGSAILIATGGVERGPRMLLARRPVRFLGRISYSLYLWHWPILVFGGLALGVTGTAAGQPGAATALAALAAASVAAGWLSWRWIEQPFHRGATGRALGIRGSLGLGLATIAAISLVAGAFDLRSVAAINDIGRGVAEVVPTPTAPGATPTPTASPSTGVATGQLPTASLAGPTIGPGPSPSPAPSPSPDLPSVASWTDIPDVSPPDPIPLPVDVQPALADARTDSERLYRDHCAAQVEDIDPPRCVYGDQAGTFTIALVGDSHAGEWFPAFEAVAKARGWRLVPYVKLSCPFIDVPVLHLALNREYTECAAWREKVIADLVADPPDVTVFAMSHRGIFPVNAADRGVEPESQAIARAVEQVPGPHLVMIDTPRTDVDIPGCIAEHPADLRACAIPRATAFTRLFGAREARVSELTGAGIIDLIPAVCPAMPCQVVNDGRIIYRDNHHLTATFSRSLAPILDARLAPFVTAIDRGSSGLPPAGMVPDVPSG